MTTFGCSFRFKCFQMFPGTGGGLILELDSLFLLARSDKLIKISSNACINGHSTWSWIRSMRGICGTGVWWCRKISNWISWANQLHLLHSEVALLDECRMQGAFEESQLCKRLKWQDYFFQKCSTEWTVFNTYIRFLFEFYFISSSLNQLEALAKKLYLQTGRF